MVMREPEYGTAPLIELKYARTILHYERVKLMLLVFVAVLNLGIGGFLLGTANRNHDLLTSTHSSLVLLKCAVDPATSVRPDGTERTDAEKRATFAACTRAGGPR